MNHLTPNPPKEKLHFFQLLFLLLYRARTQNLAKLSQVSSIFNTSK